MPAPDPKRAAIELLLLQEAGDDRGFIARASALRASGVRLGDDGHELLKLAVDRDSVAMVSALLDLGASPGFHVVTETSSGLTASPLVNYAFAHGRARIVTRLLAAGAQFDKYHSAEVRGGLLNVPPAGEHAALVLVANALAAPNASAADLLPLVRRRPEDRAAFITAVLHAGRVDLADALIACANLPLRWERYFPFESPLTAAVRAGAAQLIPRLAEQGARPNDTDGDRRSALHHALLVDDLDPDLRATMVLELLRAGAVPQLRDESGHDAFRLATERRHRDAAAVLAEHGLRYGPRQAREARAAGVRDICLTYGKADGFIYRIATPDRPFMTGGDYDGCWYCEPADAPRELTRLIPAYPDVAWFAPFLDRLLEGRELSFAEIAGHCQPHRLYGFDRLPGWN